MGKKKQTNGDGRHNHYDLGAEIGKIKGRISRIERNLKIIRTMTPNFQWLKAENDLNRAEDINEQLKKLYKEAKELDIGNFTDL